jgi:IPT/TIG domain-containing protein
MHAHIGEMGLGAALALVVCLLATSASARTVAAPTVSNFSPKAGGAGAKVSIVGSNLSGATVTFNGVQAPSVTVNKYGNALVAVVPNNPDVLTVGTGVQIAVTTPQGTVTPVETFMVTQAVKVPGTPISKPRIASFAPTAGKTGSTVAIRGTGFNGALAVKFGGIKATFRVPSKTKILATVPSNAKTGKLTVRTALGTGISISSFTVNPT